jgi:hypothetical protein
MAPFGIIDDHVEEFERRDAFEKMMNGEVLDFLN